MPLDFLPFTDGEGLTADVLNQLVQSIIDGTIFSPTAVGTVTTLLNAFSPRVTALETAVTALQTFVPVVNRRDQFVLTLGQSAVGLTQVPNLDSELVFLRGLSVPKDGIPGGFIGGYSLSGSTLTLDSALAASVVADDVLIVVYGSVI